MNRAVVRGIAVVFIIGLWSGCEMVFTFAPFSFLQRDFDALSDEQKIALSRELLESGDDAELRSAYEALAGIIASSETVDPELYLLAANLAFAASGINDLVGALAASAGDSPGLSAALDEGLSTLDTELLRAGAGHVQQLVAAGNPDISPEQYGLVGLALLLTAAEEAGGYDRLDTLTQGSPAYHTMEEAVAYLTLGGVLDYFVGEEAA